MGQDLEILTHKGEEKERKGGRGIFSYISFISLHYYFIRAS